MVKGMRRQTLEKLWESIVQEDLVPSPTRYNRIDRREIEQDGESSAEVTRLLEDSDVDGCCTVYVAWRLKRGLCFGNEHCKALLKLIAGYWVATGSISLSDSYLRRFICIYRTPEGVFTLLGPFFHSAILSAYLALRFTLGG